MKRLYLLRHAKSSWDNPELSDFDRPLNSRGIEEAKKIGEYMAKKKYIPNCIISSTAVRTRETIDLVLKNLDYKGEVEYKDSLYLLTAEEIFREMRNYNCDSLLIVGHNPGLEIFLSSIIGENLIMKTAHLAVVDLEGNELLDFTRGKDI